MRIRNHPGFRLVVLGVAFSLLLLACNGDDEVTTTAGPAPTTTAGPAPTTTQGPPPPTTAPPTTTPPPPAEPAVEVPFLALWEGSGHNDVAAEAFVHWDEDDPAVVPTSCAKCHSTTGHLDFLGADGSAAGAVDAEQPIGQTVECIACHNTATLALDSVVMPSGIELTGLGREARCMNCHQGRHSTVSVNAAVDEAGVDEDAVSEDLGFLNIHYYAAAASKYGTEAKGGYEYDGKVYDAFFVHVEGYEACHECHDAHTLELKIDECAACHAGVASAEDLYDVRMPGSLVDYDGDGDLAEGVFYEIEGVQGKLYEAILAYSADVIAAPLVYDSHSYPYFFIDTNADGVTDEDEANFGNRFVSWTPRLLKAAYNYQVSLKDPGAFAHGGKYHLQLMTDSIESLNEVLPTPIDMAGTHRIDHGHFAGSEEAFRHWDEDPAVPGSCSKCHSAGGLPLFLAEGVTISQPQANGFLCSTCHNDLSTWTRYESPEVTFPSGATISLETDVTTADMQICINCHQGRQAGSDVDNLIGDKPDNSVDDGLRFLNIHYFAAGATLFGSQVNGGYEYDGKAYVGRFEHVPAFQTCATCHDAHSLQVEIQACGGCHAGVASREDLETIRIDPSDWDGDGDTTEGIRLEIDGLKVILLTAMEGYANATEGVDLITYNSNAYPYYFNDVGDRYGTWTPNLLRAAYNYQYASKDPGGFAHNGKYVIQLLYDAIEGLGGDVSGLTRP